MRELRPFTGRFLLVYEGKVPRELGRVDRGWIVSFTSKPPAGSVAGPDLLRSVDGVPVDQNKWLDDGHVTFANLQFEDHKRMQNFMMRYGLSGHFFNKDWQSNEWFVDPAFIRKWQTRLRGAWSAQEPQLWFHPRSVALDIRSGKIHLATPDLWTFICLSFLTDHSQGRTAVCKFAGCKNSPYFLKSRRDQEFCSKRCRALENMKSWRLKPSNRRRENRRRRERQIQYATQDEA